MGGGEGRGSINSQLKKLTSVGEGINWQPTHKVEIYRGGRWGDGGQLTTNSDRIHSQLREDPHRLLVLEGGSIDNQLRQDPQPTQKVEICRGGRGGVNQQPTQKVEICRGGRQGEGVNQQPTQTGSTANSERIHADCWSGGSINNQLREDPQPTQRGSTVLIWGEGSIDNQLREDLQPTQRGSAECWSWGWVDRQSTQRGSAANSERIHTECVDPWGISMLPDMPCEARVGH